MKVSIITATLNSEKTIKDNLISVDNQSYNNIEHIIIDGNSNDKTLEIIVKNKASKKIIIHSSKDKGIYYALNKGIDLSTGEIICFLNSDDFYFDKNTISKVVNCFKISNADVVYGNLNYITKNNSKVLRKWTSNDFNFFLLKKGWMPPHPSTFVKKKIINKKNWFNTNYKISADYDFLIKLFRNDLLKKKYLNEIIVNMRIGGISNNSFSNIIRKTKEDYQIIKQNRLGGLFTLFLKNIKKIPQFF
jgi:glycosyltransferase involved in cell wall biosynthesis